MCVRSEYFYYFVRLLDVNDAQISYDYIQIPLNEFTKQLSDLGKAGKVTEYISISKEDAL